MLRLRIEEKEQTRLTLVIIKSETKLILHLTRHEIKINKKIKINIVRRKRTCV